RGGEHLAVLFDCRVELGTRVRRHLRRLPLGNTNIIGGKKISKADQTSTGDLVHDFSPLETQLERNSQERAECREHLKKESVRWHCDRIAAHAGEQVERV